MKKSSYLVLSILLLSLLMTNCAILQKNSSTAKDIYLVDSKFFSFEAGTDGWVNNAPKGSHGKFEFVADPGGRKGKSLKVSVNNSTVIYLNSPNVVKLEQGKKYKVSYKLFLNSRANLRNGFSLLLIPEGVKNLKHENVIKSPWMAYNNVHHFKEGEWVAHSFETKAKGSGNYRLQIRIGKGNAKEYGTFYVDDIKIEPID